MELRQLKYFLKIVEEQNLSRAAEALHMVQPALTRQLKALENELGIVLIDRTTRRFELTSAGMHLAYRARQMVDLEQSLIHEMEELKSGVSGMIRIGTIGSEMERLLPQVILEFSERYPEVRFKSIETSSFEVMELLEKGLIDVGFVRTPINLSGCGHFVLPSHPMVIATVNEEFWETGVVSIGYSALENQPLIVHNRFSSVIENGCRAAGFEPLIRVSVEDTRSLLLLASKGIGAAVVQKDWLGMVDTSFNQVVLNEPLLQTETAVVWSNKIALSKTSELFIKNICHLGFQNEY